MPEGDRGDGRVVDRVGAIGQAVTAVASILVGVKVEFSKYRYFANLICCSFKNKNLEVWRYSSLALLHML